MVDLASWQAGRPAVLTLVPVTRGRPCLRAVSTQPKNTTVLPASTSNSSSLLKDLGAKGLQLCVWMCVWFRSVFPGSSQNSQTHTPTFQRGVKVIGSATAQLRKSCEVLQKSLLRILEELLILTLGIFVGLDVIFVFCEIWTGIFLSMCHSE